MNRLHLNTLALISGLSLATAANAGGGGSVSSDANQYFNGGTATTAGYTGSWLRRTLDLQNKLDYDEPLAKATFIMTHNSYNSAAYRTAVSYLDPNHNISIDAQLSAGVRSIELDVHRYFSMSGWPWEWKTRLLLCHGQSNHMGCSSYDRFFESGVDEVKNWLNRSENRNEVIVIYIEDHMDGAYGDAINILSSRIGSKIYRPAGSGCQGIPMNISKRQILNAGKQVLIMGGGDVCSSNSGWNTWAYAGVGDRLSGYPTGSIKNITGGENCEFDRNFYDNYWVRFYEDRTTISALFGSPESINETTAANLQKCGVNLIGFDKLNADDSRLTASVWSWNTNEPNDWGGNEDCAENIGSGRMNDASCGNVQRFACQKPGTHEWYVTQGSGAFASGVSVCSSETGGQFAFAVPTNGYDNEKLKAAKSARGASNVWVNLSDRSVEGEWAVNKR